MSLADPLRSRQPPRPAARVTRICSLACRRGSSAKWAYRWVEAIFECPSSLPITERLWPRWRSQSDAEDRAPGRRRCRPRSGPDPRAGWRVLRGFPRLPPGITNGLPSTCSSPSRISRAAELRITVRFPVFESDGCPAVELCARTRSVFWTSPNRFERIPPLKLPFRTVRCGDSNQGSVRAIGVPVSSDPMPKATKKPSFPPASQCLTPGRATNPNLRLRRLSEAESRFRGSSRSLADPWTHAHRDRLQWIRSLVEARGGFSPQ